MTNLDRYTTESLQADVAYGGLGVHMHPRQARQLLRLDTPERRRRAAYDAMTRQNLRGGILSSNIAEAVSALLAMIAAEAEDGELWGERVAREAREREAELRKIQPGAIYVPPELRTR